MPSVPVVERLTAAISGANEVGDTLTAQTNAPPEGSNFGWLRDGMAIGATANAPTYQLSATLVAVAWRPDHTNPSGQHIFNVGVRRGFELVCQSSYGTLRRAVNYSADMPLKDPE